MNSGLTGTRDGSLNHRQALCALKGKDGCGNLEGRIEPSVGKWGFPRLEKPARQESGEQNVLET